jgi:hypothetical protein
MPPGCRDLWKQNVLSTRPIPSMGTNSQKRSQSTPTSNTPLKGAALPRSGIEDPLKFPLDVASAPYGDVDLVSYQAVVPPATLRKVLQRLFLVSSRPAMYMVEVASVEQEAFFGGDDGLPGRRPTRKFVEHPFFVSEQAATHPVRRVSDVGIFHVR